MYPIMIFLRFCVRFGWIATSINSIRHFINHNTYFGVSNLVLAVILLVLIYICDYIVNYKFKNMAEYNQMLENLVLFRMNHKLYKTVGKDEFFQIKEIKTSLKNKIRHGPKFEKIEITPEQLKTML